MKTLNSALIAAGLSALLWQPAAAAGPLGTGDRPTLRCAITECQPASNCGAPFQLGNTMLNAGTGSNFLFQITDIWKVSPARFRLEDERYMGATYLERTTVNADIDRTSGALRMALAFDSRDNSSRHAIARGTCEAIDTVPVRF